MAQPVTDIDLAADTTGNPTLLKSGSLTFFLIERAGKLGVRVRDAENPHRKNFAGLQYFPVRRFDWVINARFEPYQPRKHVKIVNILGMEEELDAPRRARLHRKTARNTGWTPCSKIPKTPSSS